MRILFLLLTASLIGIKSFSQQGASNFAQQYAAKIAQRMKDSLGLSDDQKSQVYAINMNLFSQKSKVWQTYSNQDSLKVNIQAIEDKRNLMYLNVLTQDQYSVFIKNRARLLNND